MRKLSVGEFEELNDRKGYSRYIFTSAIQPEGDYDCMGVHLNADSMFVVQRPNLVCLKNEDSSLVFGSVQYVLGSHTDAGDKFVLVCDSRNYGEKRYCVIAN